MAENQNRLWASYVNAIVGDMPAQAVADRIAERVGQGVSQPTVSRWLRGEASAEIKPANVAAFATAFGRAVLEAFVAAGLLTIDDVGPGLDDESIAFVVQLKSDVTPVRSRAAPTTRRRQPQPRRP